LQEYCQDGIQVELRDVEFAYPGRNTATLENITAIVESGERVVLNGSNGSGKSTLLQVIGGLYDTQKGTVIYDGFTKGNLDPDSLRAVIGDSLRDELLFDGTILENITMGRELATLGNVQWAIENVGLQDYIKGQPQGLNTQLDPMGKKLPKSIVQKIILARSIVIKPKLLLLDNVLRNIEYNEKNRIVNFLTDRSNKWTMIAVSDDPYLIEKSDRKINLDQGSIVETRYAETL
jgi:ABC-type bacteriocin/lantibiotic exporter with double-glycine peptidase domain